MPLSAPRSAKLHGRSRIFVGPFWRKGPRGMPSPRQPKRASYEGKTDHAVVKTFEWCLAPGREPLQARLANAAFCSARPLDYGVRDGCDVGVNPLEVRENVQMDVAGIERFAIALVEPLDVGLAAAPF
jgi:hypothetical protein